MKPAAAGTIIVADALTLPDVAEMIAVPGPVPVASTNDGRTVALRLATAGLSLDHTIGRPYTRVPAAVFMSASTVTLPPTMRCAETGVTLIEAIGPAGVPANAIAPVSKQ